MDNDRTPQTEETRRRMTRRLHEPMNVHNPANASEDIATEDIHPFFRCPGRPSTSTSSSSTSMSLTLGPEAMERLGQMLWTGRDMEAQMTCQAHPRRRRWKKTTWCTSWRDWQPEGAEPQDGERERTERGIAAVAGGHAKMNRKKGIETVEDDRYGDPPQAENTTRTSQPRGAHTIHA